MNRGEEIVHKYILIIKEYLQHMMQSQTLKTIDNSTYIIVIGLNTIIHVFKIILSTTKDIDKTYIQCQKAYYCYLEYIEQMNKTNFLHNLNNLNAILFVYKKTVAVELVADKNLSMKDNTINNEVIPLMNIFFNSEEQIEIVSRRIVSSEPDIFHTLNLISSATKTILFFTDELYFETEENRIKDIEQCSNLVVNGYKERSPPDQNNTDKTISIEEIIQLVDNHLRKILLLCVSEGFTGTGGAVKPRSSVDVDELRSSKSMDDSPSEYDTCQGTLRSSTQIIFDYINLLQEKLVMDYNTYDEFLLEFYKKIKQLKRANKMPSLCQINKNSLNYFYREENLQELKKMLETKKYNAFVKILFTF